MRFNTVNLDLIVVSSVIRLILGIFLGAAFGLVGWLIDLWVFQFITRTPIMFPFVVITTISMTVSFGVLLSWWNWNTPWKARLAQAGTMLVAALVSNALTFIISTSNSGYIWFERGVLFPVLNIAVLVTTIIALGFYLHRTLIRREV